MSDRKGMSRRAFLGASAGGLLVRVKDVTPVMTVIDGQVAFHDKAGGVVIYKE